MGWSIGEDDGRDIGYGVPATCDYPGCTEKIDRGLSYVCGGEPYGGDEGCGLFFCEDHLGWGESGRQLCERCIDGEEPFEPSPDVPEWLEYKLNDLSWQEWRDEHPEQVVAMKAALGG